MILPTAPVHETARYPSSSDGSILKVTFFQEWVRSDRRKMKLMLSEAMKKPRNLSASRLSGGE
jgi:hypothetical protein